MKSVFYILGTLVFIFLIPVSLKVHGQSTPVFPAKYLPEDEEVNTQLWLDWNPRLKINARSSAYLPVGFRTNFTQNQYRIYGRPTYRYDITRLNERTNRYRTWQLIGGAGVFYTRNPDVTDILELRPFQGVKVRFPNLDRVHLVHYLRLEERLEIGINPFGTKFSIRGRYKVGSDLFLPSNPIINGIYIPLYAEFFFSVAEQGFQFNDLIRLTPGLGYQPGLNWKFQFELSYHRIRPTSSDKFQTNDIVFRFRVYQLL